MKRYLLTVFALGLAMQAQAQLLYVGNTGLVHVEDQALVYSGGGVKVDTGGKIDNIGDIMINGTSADKLETAGTGTFTLKRTSATVYGQLSVDGLTQTNMTNTAGTNQGVVIKEMQYDENHGAFQQIAIPYKGKLVSEYGTDTGNTVTGPSRQGKVLVWNNGMSRWDVIESTASTTNPVAYYILNKNIAGGTVWDVNTITKNIKGEPFADNDTNLTQTLTGGGNVAFGANGINRNVYNQKYSTYVNDPFRATGWAATDYGKELYQFGNPFLCNIDLSNIGINEGSTPTDGNFINNIVGIRTRPTSVTFTLANNVGTSTSQPGQIVLFSNGAPSAGDKDKCIIKPFETFYIKLDPTLAQTGGDNVLNFKGLRRFSQTARAAATSYSVSAAKGAKANKSTTATSPVRQLGVFAYDINGEKLGNTYFTVSRFSPTGYDLTNNMQAANAAASPVIFTQEEVAQGGVDVQNVSDKLYINTANEVDFLGKALPLTVDNNQATVLKFNLYENLQDVDALSSGESYYLQDDTTGELTQIDNTTVVNVKAKNYSLYYGKPAVTLGTSNLALDNNTHVFKSNDQYVVRFNKQKSSANVEVFNLAGQLISSDAKVETSSDLKLNLAENANATYVVKVTYNDATVVTKKIVK